MGRVGVNGAGVAFWNNRIVALMPTGNQSRPQPDEEAQIPLHSSLTVEQITGVLLAIPAFLPATVCTGYLFAWSTNFHAFRDRSLVERIFWSLPLSFAISTISSVLIGRFLSLTAVVIFFLLSAAGCILALGIELRTKRRSGENWCVGFQPLGASALALTLLWIAFTVFSLVDLQRDHRLFMNVAVLDQSYRINWTESVLRTGVPPDNSLYLYKHTAPMRNYYFWYVVCAAVAKMAHLSVRADFNASCIWAGFTLAALIGLYLKYFLAVGARLRRQFLLTIGLACVTGLDVAAVLFNLFFYHLSPPADLEAWSRDGIPSWLHTLFWAPHHLVSMLCCMLALLLAWIDSRQTHSRGVLTAILVALALSSAFGLSIYVTFAFFLAAITWAVWQVVIERKWRPPLVLAAGGTGSLMLLIPYLYQLTHSTSGSSANSTGPPAPLFSFAVRQMIPPDGLLSTGFFHSLPLSTGAAATFARLLLLVPGYSLELGFFLAVLFLWLIPAWRGHTRLSSSQRTLLFIVCAMVPFMSFIRSGVLQTNDFAWRAALFVQFPLLLLASELITSWNVEDHKANAPTLVAGLPGPTPRWLRVVASLALVIGVFSTITQALMFRFLIPLGDIATHQGSDPYARDLSQKAYISAIGFAALDKVILQNAIVQADPENMDKDRMAEIVNLIGIDHQTVIAADNGECGAELGGDVSGCPILAKAIDQLYNGASASQAQDACRKYGINYLVARVYEPVWKERNGWVWTLDLAFANDDFRAIKCGG